jgi:uncharacterized lipoprotein YmbA
MSRLSVLAAVFSCVLMTVVSGCRSLTPAVTYYTLGSPPSEQPSAVTDSSRIRALTIGIRPVELPGYMERSQMVIRSGPHQLDASSLHRWADYPDRMVQQAINENLQTLLPSALVVSSPSPMGLKADIVLSFYFLELIGTADGRMLLSVRWTITIAGEEIPSSVQSHRTTVSEALSGPGFDELAAAHGRVLERLSREVAGALERIPVP